MSLSLYQTLSRSLEKRWMGWCTCNGTHITTIFSFDGWWLYIGTCIMLMVAQWCACFHPHILLIECVLRVSFESPWRWWHRVCTVLDFTKGSRGKTTMVGHLHLYKPNSDWVKYVGKRRVNFKEIWPAQQIGHEGKPCKPMQFDAST